MTIEILTNEHDDPQFVELAKQLISGLMTIDFPDEIFVVKIDNWFDHKWLKFSGIGRVGFFLDFRLERDTALDEFRQDKITIPPFNPNRVVGEYYFVRDSAGECVASLGKPYVHERKLASSSHNLHKRIIDLASSALLVWLSSNTKKNGRGSIMVYEVNGPDVQTWYVGLSKQEKEWKVHRTEGITLGQVQSLIEG
jgi:hypothetical protein